MPVPCGVNDGAPLRLFLPLGRLRLGKLPGGFHTLFLVHIAIAVVIDPVAAFFIRSPVIASQGRIRQLNRPQYKVWPS